MWRVPADVTFTVSISHRQLAVFDPTLDAPFNDWNTQHAQQGFAWRPGSVSFTTMLDSGRVEVGVSVRQQAVPDEHAWCRIEVPFVVPPHGQVAVASIMDEHELDLQPGAYQLHYEARQTHVRLTFTPSREAVFRIHKQDDPTKSLVVLTTEAEPAD